MVPRAVQVVWSARSSMTTTNSASRTPASKTLLRNGSSAQANATTGQPSALHLFQRMQLCHAMSMACMMQLLKVTVCIRLLNCPNGMLASVRSSGLLAPFPYTDRQGTPNGQRSKALRRARHIHTSMQTPLDQHADLQSALHRLMCSHGHAHATLKSKSSLAAGTIGCCASAQ